MDQIMTPDQVADRCRERGMSYAELCRRAGCNPSTFVRWRNGQTDLTLGTYRRIIDVLDEEDSTCSDETKSPA